MPILKIGLVGGALACLYVTWASWSAGYQIEAALLRGLLSFMAMSFVAYLGELVVATAPPTDVPVDTAGLAFEAAGADEGSDLDAAGRAPIPIRPVLEEREAA